MSVLQFLREENRMLKAATTVVANYIENTPREGEEEDKPEGARYIKISDTMARELVGMLRRESK